MIITEKDLQMLHSMPPPPPGEPLLPRREDDLNLGESRGVTPSRSQRQRSRISHIIKRLIIYPSSKAIKLQLL